MTTAYLDGLAGQITGLNYSKWNSDQSSAALSSQVQADETAAQAAGFDSTPTIVIKGPKSQAQPIVGNPTSYSAARNGDQIGLMTFPLRRVMLVLTIIGLGVATYLTIIHYAGLKPACTAGQSCIKVQTSQWSKLDGVPVALLGLIGYVGILASLLAPDREEIRLATLGLTLIGVGFSGYLTYRELFSIHAICEWCASSAVILALLFVSACIRYVTVSDAAPLPAPAATPPRPAAGRPRARSGRT